LTARITKPFKTIWIPLAMILLGALLNIVVIKANGGMPAMNVGPADAPWVPITAQTHFAFLGDIIPILGYEFSPGDILVYLGTLIWLGIALRFLGRTLANRAERRFSWY
jgi:hypothetical protein